MRTYKLTQQQREMFQQMYLLWRMQSPEEHFSILLPGTLGMLEPLFTSLHVKGLVTILDGEYRTNTLGEECLTKFHTRYTDYLQMYDIYCAVDLGVGEFAYDMVLELSPKRFKNYLDQDRWEDLRIAVAAYKGLDPVEIVFMSFLNEGRFTQNGVGWTIDLLGDLLWDEILRICNSALHAEDLGTNDVIEDIITQGSTLMVELLQRATHLETQRQVDPSLASAPTTTQDVITTTETVTYVEEVTTYNSQWGYAPYDYCYITSPIFVAPIWYEPYWYW